jgi:hypothetical protein
MFQPHTYSKRSQSDSSDRTVREEFSGSGVRVGNDNISFEEEVFMDVDERAAGVSGKIEGLNQSTGKLIALGVVGTKRHLYQESFGAVNMGAGGTSLFGGAKGDSAKGSINRLHHRR